MKKRICHISTVHPLFDDRIFYKECISLTEFYDVYLVVVHSTSEVINNVNIIGLPKARNRWIRLFKNSWKAFKRAIEIKPDIIHIHDPELLWIGVLFRLLGKKTLYDVHEDISKQVLYKNWLGVKWIRVVFSKIVLVVEKFCSLFYNRIVVVTEDIRRNFPKSKTVLVRNFPKLDLIRNAVNVNVTKSSKVVIYVGSLSKERGILELVNSIEQTTAELWLLGPWDSNEYEDSCRKANGWKKTKYFGIKKLEEVYGYLKYANVAVAILYPAKNYVTSLPVKAFEYMAMGVPMVISDFPYWREVFDECAIFANPYDPQDIADKINYLLENKEVCDQMITKSLALIQSEFSWEAESQKLIEMYSGLITK